LLIRCYINYYFGDLTDVLELFTCVFNLAYFANLSSLQTDLENSKMKHYLESQNPLFE